MQGYQSNTLLTTEELVQLEVFISARGLLDMDVFSKSDPYVKVYFKRTPTSQWVFLGRTETVDNCLNPNFQNSFVLDYIFEAKQELKFEVFDQDDKLNSKNDDFIGSVQTTLGTLAGARDQTSILNLGSNSKKSNPGKIILRVEPVAVSNGFVKMKWRAHKLMNTDSWFDFWDKSDPYLKFLKLRKDNTFVEATRTEVIMNNLSPSWKDLDVRISRLVREDNKEQKFKVECWDWEEEGEPKHQFIGEVYLTLPGIINAKLPAQIPLSNPKHSKPGTIILERINYYEKPTFIDYLRGGLQLNLSVAIDFTGSNGTPSAPTSLHYMNPYQPNQYQRAIMAVGSILLNYDYDKMIPAFGFGARPKFPDLHRNSVDHCFPLSGNYNTIQAFGLDGLMNLYANALGHVDLSGPTYFGPILQKFISIARQSHSQGGRSYQILLILTDGEIHDMEKTVDLIVDNCNLPLSIIIVGIGNASFSNMVRLDGDNGLFNSKGRMANRDIVQFVPFNQVSGNSDLLAKELLAELPDQVVQYMTVMGIPPGKPAQVDLAALMAENAVEIEQGLKNNLPKIFEQLTMGNNKGSSQPGPV